MNQKGGVDRAAGRPPVELKQLREVVRDMRDHAIGTVRQYAAEHCPDVPSDMVLAIENALLEISVDEAFAALDRSEGCADCARTVFARDRAASSRDETRHALSVPQLQRRDGRPGRSPRRAGPPAMRSDHERRRRRGR